MDAEQFLEKLRHVEAENRALREYAQKLEWELKEARGETARDDAFTETDKRLGEIRYETGLRAGLTLR